MHVAIPGMGATVATKITVVLEDDLEGGPADETVRFGIGGTGYEIDLNAANCHRSHQPEPARRPKGARQFSASVSRLTALLQ